MMPQWGGAISYCLFTPFTSPHSSSLLNYNHSSSLLSLQEYKDSNIIMRKLLTLSMVLMALVLASCDETTDIIGSSLTDNKDRLTVTTDTFAVASRTVKADSVLARNITGYLGTVKDPETLNTITGSFMAQFNILDGFALPKEDSIARDEGGQVMADSCELRLYYTTFYGDSLAPMKLSVHELEKPLEEGTAIYSNYNPEKGYVRAGGLTTSRTYTLSDRFSSDSLRATSDYTPNIRVKLAGEYTDKDGKTYNNYGTYIMQQYYAHPEYFSSNWRFLHHVVPGFYFKMEDGVGAMAYVTTAQLNLYFRYVTADSTYRYSTSFTGTEEVLQTTTFSNDDTQLQQMTGDGSCTYLKSPAGLFTELTLPVDDIMKGHENDTLNSVKLTLPCLHSLSDTGYELEPSAYLLMLPKDSLQSFFANNSLPDSHVSFIASYTSTANSYTFSNFAGIISAMQKCDRSSADWNKVVLVPVSVTTHTTSTSTTITKVTHNMGMSSVRLLGGTDNPDALKLSVIYSRFQN